MCISSPRHADLNDIIIPVRFYSASKRMVDILNDVQINIYWRYKFNDSGKL